MHVHAHPHAAAAGRRLAGALLLSLLTAVTELWGATHSGSLALLADAGHVAFDSLAIALAWGALQVGRRPATARMTWGYGRVEVLAAGGNGLALLGVAGMLAHEGLARGLQPQAIAAPTMMLTAAVGLLGNGASLWLLQGCSHNVGVRAALLHVAGDVLVALAVLVGGACMHWFGLRSLDGWLTVAIACVLASGALRLLAGVGRILLEAAPAQLDTDEVRAAIAAIAGVAHVEALHVWCLTPDAPLLVAHVRQTADAPPATALSEAIGAVVRDRFGVHHSTVQVHRALLTET